MRKFLLIENDEIEAQALKDTLNSGLSHPFELTLSSSLKEGLEQIKEGDFDLIFLDLGISDSSSPEKAVHQVFELAPNTPMLILTDNDDFEMGLKAVRLGAQDYIIKGIMPVQVVCRCVEFALIRKSVENELIVQREEAIRKNQFKSLFLASMSHDLRAPLTAILNVAPLLKEVKDESSRAEILNVLERAGRTQLKIIDDILDITKLEAGEIKLNIEPINFSHAVRNIITTLKINAYKKGLALNFEIADGISKYVKTDDACLRRILSNLVNNAIKFTTQGSIHLSVSLKDGLYFEIKDTGVGIPADKIGDVFKAFEQVSHDIAANPGGTGLGLSICKHRVKLLGGDIGVESVLGQGSTFYFRIPYEPAEALKTVSKDEIESSFEEKSILIADDSECGRVLLKHLLRDTPYELTFVVNGKEAVEKFKGQKFDVVLLDMHMDVMSGYEAVALMRDYEKEKQIEPTPVIAFTAAIMADEVKRCYAQGCTDILSKPFKRPDILRKISSVKSLVRSAS